MPNTETPAPLALDSPDLSLADFRALREGRQVTPAIETPSAADAATADAETAVDPETTETSSETSQDKPKGDKLKIRFSELTGKIKALETQLAAKNAPGPTETKVESKPAAPVVIAPDPKDPEPDPAKFESYIDWQKNWNRWDRRQETKQAETARAAADQQAAATAKATTWNERVKTTSADLPDFKAVALNEDLPVTQVMADAITDSEIGPALLYHLGQNPEEAARIAKLSPVSQVREIGRLEKSLEPDPAETSEETPIKKTSVSKAPSPHRPVAGASAASPSVKVTDTMTQAEFRALRESGKLR